MKHGLIVFPLIVILSSFTFSSTVIETTGDNGIITPIDEFFNIFIEDDYFYIDAEEYRLTVTGAVNNSLSLSLEEIKSMPVTSEIVRMTCVGYRSGSIQLTGVANFTGVRLSYILDLAKINYNDAEDISFHTPSPAGYSTSLNLTEAYWDDVILAYEMNGETLPIEHGFPIKLVCPRFYGYKWIKWLSTINVETNDYLGFWEGRGYDDSPYIDPILNLQIYYTSILNTSQTSFIPPTSVSSDSDRVTPWLTLEILMATALIFFSSNRIISSYLKKRRYKNG